MPVHSPKRASLTQGIELKEPAADVAESGRVKCPLAVPAWLVSAIAHCLLLVVLCLWTVATLSDDRHALVVDCHADVDDDLADFVETALVIARPVALETHPVSDVEWQPLLLGRSDVGTEIEASLEFDHTVPRASVEASAVLAAQFGEDWLAEVRPSAPRQQVTFFGAKTYGRRFVFVVDNSNSMTRGRFETVLNELNDTIDSMTPDQQFYVVFFSDAAYRMFHPNTTEDFHVANARNKERLRSWLYQVEMCLMTRGQEALKIALRMEPDAIYVLSDGAFTDGAASIMTVPHQRSIPVHTIGMSVNSRGADQLRAIAAVNDGTYRDVSPTDKARLQAERNPINRNWSRGAVWGTNLRAQQ